MKGIVYDGTSTEVSHEIEVRDLSDDHLSRDLLEERARLLLGYADPRDYVIRNNN